VTGVDISDLESERAWRRVPGARFVRADGTGARFRAGSFGGVLCLYSLVHVPRDEQLPLFARLFRWLQPEGLFLVTTGQSVCAGAGENGFGSNAKSYASVASVQTYQEWLRQAGFEVVRRTRIPETGREPSLFLARKPAEPLRP
jgi:SAM-dependent methyltransferase